MTDYQITIKNAVLHILDTNVGTPVFSNKEIELDLEISDFLENITSKMLNDDNLKNTVFLESSNPVREACLRFKEGQTGFLDLSRQFAEELYQMMFENLDIPAADLICTYLSIDDQMFLGIFKLNYRSGYIHFVEYEGETNVNRLVKQKTVLPGDNQKPEESILINLDDLTIRLIEKQYEIMGEKEYYLSKRFLGCQDQLSSLQKAQIISKVAEKVNKKYNTEEVDCIARLRKTVTESIDDLKTVGVENVARQIFHDNPMAQREYVEEIKQAGIQEAEVNLSAKVTDRKFRNQKIKTDTGIEIYFPSTYYNNKEIIEFVNQPNGTVSIIIKNIGKILNK